MPQKLSGQSSELVMDEIYVGGKTSDNVTLSGRNPMRQGGSQSVPSKQVSGSNSNNDGSTSGVQKQKTSFWSNLTSSKPAGQSTAKSQINQTKQAPQPIRK